MFFVALSSPGCSGILLTLRQGGCGCGTTAYKNAKQVRMNKPGLPRNTLIAFRACSGIGSSACFFQQPIHSVCLSALSGYPIARSTALLNGPVFSCCRMIPAPWLRTGKLSMRGSACGGTSQHRAPRSMKQRHLALKVIPRHRHGTKAAFELGADFSTCQLIETSQRTYGVLNVFADIAGDTMIDHLGYRAAIE